VLTSFVRMTPALQRGAAETHTRWAAHIYHKPLIEIPACFGANK
jgi:hypothetical protein